MNNVLRPPPATDAVLERLGRSRFRSSFMLRDKEIAYLRTRGRAVIEEHAGTFILQRLADALPARDGRQTPMSGHPVFIAQHATATCCRRCIATWHGIATGTALTPDQCEHLQRLILAWLENQLRAHQRRT